MLTIPLSQAQVDAAVRLSDKLSGWKLLENTVRLLREKLPGFSPEETLLKVVAINSLCATKIYAIHRLAEHVTATLRKTDFRLAGPELVESLAQMPAKDRKKPRRNQSFASKFASQFIDAERFPILDAFAEQTVARHLGPAISRGTPDHRYRTFCENVASLRQLAGITSSMAEFDRYLWLAGVYHQSKKPNSTVSDEVVQLFNTTSKAASQDVRILIGN